ncbi:MAG: hypothetical protein JWP57_1648 [Spirosoma sp.]|nr:hypothetical protein [Spirosoma sp.]
MRLLSGLPIQHGSGPAFDQGELLRWLAETPWFPISLLPGGRAVWSPVDDNSATLTLTDHGQTVSCLMSFNEQNELVRCQAQRHTDETHVETWVCRLSDYRDWHGLRIPTQGEPPGSLGARKNHMPASPCATSPTISLLRMNDPTENLVQGSVSPYDQFSIEQESMGPTKDSGVLIPV